MLKILQQCINYYLLVFHFCLIVAEKPWLSITRFSQTATSRQHSIHSVGPNEFDRRMDNGPVSPVNTVEGSDPRLNEPGLNTGYFPFLTRRFADMEKPEPQLKRVGRQFGPGFGPSEYGQNADIVHIKITRNNTFVTVTDSKGNKKMGSSAGSLAEMKGGPKVSKYFAEATAEHVGRLAQSIGLKSVVLKVNGFTFFKKKKLAIFRFRDGYTNSRSDRNPIVYIEDTTRKAHNGCPLKKQRVILMVF